MKFAAKTEIIQVMVARTAIFHSYVELPKIKKGGMDSKKISAAPADPSLHSPPWSFDLRSHMDFLGEICGCLWIYMESLCQKMSKIGYLHIHR